MAKKTQQQLATLITRATQLHRQGDLVRAREAYQKVLKHAPDDAGTLGLLAVVRFQQGQHAAALELMRRACTLAPDGAGLRNNLGKMLLEVGNYDEAEREFRACLQADPGFAMAAGSLGAVLMVQGRTDEAIAAFEQAIRLSPKTAEYYMRLATALTRSHRFREAEAALRAAANLTPNDIRTRLEFAALLYHRRRFEDSVREYQLALKLDQQNLTARAGLLLSRLHLADWQDFDAERQRFLSAVRSAKPSPSIDILLPYVTTLISNDPVDCLAAAKVATGGVPVPAYSRSSGSRSKIRVAYASADYREHATSYLLCEVIERHDRSQFEVIGVSHGPRKPNPMRQRIQAAFDRFIDVADRSTAQIVDTMRQCDIDIAIDLHSFTTYNRMEAFARRVAPIQVCYLGWPGTSGAPWYDYVLADRIVAPDENLACFSESVVWLPHSYQPNAKTRVRATGADARRVRVARRSTRVLLLQQPHEDRARGLRCVDAHPGRGAGRRSVAPCLQ